MPSTLLEAVAQEEAERAIRFEQAWRLYLGEHGGQLVVTAGEANDNVTLNYPGLFVDKGVSFLVGRQPDFQVEPVATPDNTGQIPQAAANEANAAEAELARVWRLNSGQSLLQKMATNGGVCGHVFVRVLEAEPAPRLVNIDPSYMSVVWDEDDIGRVNEYRMTWPTTWQGDPAVRRNRFTREDTADGAERWVISREVSRQHSIDNGVPRMTQWQPIAEPEVWPWPWSPIVDWQNLPMPNEYWGRNDFEKGVEQLTAAVELAASNMNRILKFYGHPRPWVAGASPEQVAAVNAAIGYVTTLPDGVTVGNFGVEANLEGALGYFKELMQSLHDMARVPRVATSQVEDIGSLSGVALRILYQPLMELTETKHGTYGPGLQAINLRLLDMADLLPGEMEEVIVNNVWADNLPEDPKEEAETAVARQAAGVSKRTTLEELGYDPDREAERKEADGDNALAAAQAAADAFNRGTAIE